MIACKQAPSSPLLNSMTQSEATRSRCLNGVVIGVGHFGKFHAQKLAADPRVNFVGIVDLRESLARALADEYHVMAFSGLEEVDVALDFVTIATPARTHAMLARQAMKRGCHAFIEKPISTTVEDAEALIALAKQQGVVLQVDHQERYFLEEIGLFQSVDPLAVRQLTVRRLGPPPPMPPDCSAVLDLTIHDLDWIHAFVGNGLETLQVDGTWGDSGLVEALRLTGKVGPRQIPVVIETSRMDPERCREAEITLDGEVEPYHINFIERSFQAPTQPLTYSRDLPPSSDLYGVHPFEPLDYVGKSFAHFIYCIAASLRPKVDGPAALAALQSALIIEDLLSPRS